VGILTGSRDPVWFSTVPRAGIGAIRLNLFSLKESCFLSGN